uniref:Uncharacterized protein n=1 Tax=Mycena chlorophos TaxID=658473 RepID=A0ABQ0M114_MYCCL|nr:predicted protein [Mycena chlorophos]
MESAKSTEMSNARASIWTNIARTRISRRLSPPTRCFDRSGPICRRIPLARSAFAPASWMEIYHANRIGVVRLWSRAPASVQLLYERPNHASVQASLVLSLRVIKRMKPAYRAQSISSASPSTLDSGEFESEETKDDSFAGSHRSWAFARGLTPQNSSLMLALDPYRGCSKGDVAGLVVAKHWEEAEEAASKKPVPPMRLQQPPQEDVQPPLLLRGKGGDKLTGELHHLSRLEFVQQIMKHVPIGLNGVRNHLRVVLGVVCAADQFLENKNARLRLGVRIADNWLVSIRNPGWMIGTVRTGDTKADLARLLPGATAIYSSSASTAGSSPTPVQALVDNNSAQLPSDDAISAPTLRSGGFATATEAKQAVIQILSGFEDELQAAKAEAHRLTHLLVAETNLRFAAEQGLEEMEKKIRELEQELVAEHHARTFAEDQLELTSELSRQRLDEAHTIRAVVDQYLAVDAKE